MSPHDLFIEWLDEHEDFERLKGWTLQGWTEDYDLQSFPPKINRRKTWVKYPNKIHPSRHWLYRKPNTKGYAVIELPEMHYSFLNLVFLKTVWVDEKYGNQGIATQCMRELIDLTDDVDNEAKKEDGLTFHSCSFYCVPNPFWVDHWIEEKIEEVDWTRPKSVDGELEDETYKELEKDKLRVDWEKLRDWYRSFGFVEVKELAMLEGCDMSNPAIWKPYRRNMFSQRSQSLGRWPLLYPAINAEIHRGIEDED